MKIRDMTVEDCLEVSLIEKEVFSMPWSRDNFEGSVLQENYCMLVAEDEEDKTILGYCCFYYVIDEAEIPNVCVRADVRKRHIGRTLMEALIERAKELGVARMFLEVRETNTAAQGLYYSLGFKQISVRKNFYEFPQEDALVLELRLEKE